MSTSKLQRYVSSLLSAHFGQYTIRENIRPPWLIGPEGRRLELDFFIEDLLVAIEVQGKQHYAYFEYFHGSPEGFSRQLRFDRAKRELCDQYGIRLYEIENSTTAADVIQTIIDKNHSLEEIQPQRDANLLKTVRIMTRLLNAHNNSSGRKRHSNRRVAKRYYHFLVRRFWERYSHISDLPEDDARLLMSAVKKYEDIKRQIAERREYLLKFSRVERRAIEKLHIQQLNSICYRVWGGLDEHLVVLLPDGPKCDCDVHSEGCSHTTKYRQVFIDGIGQPSLESTES